MYYYYYNYFVPERQLTVHTFSHVTTLQTVAERSLPHFSIERNVKDGIETLHFTWLFHIHIVITPHLKVAIHMDKSLDLIKNCRTGKANEPYRGKSRFLFQMICSVSPKMFSFWGLCDAKANIIWLWPGYLALFATITTTINHHHNHHQQRLSNEW